MSNSDESENQHDELEIFAHAMELPTDEQAAYLARVCGSDAELRRRVENLLRLDRHAEENEFLSPTPLNLMRSIREESTDEAPLVGREVGAFQIVKQIGKGGMGQVYLAQRKEGYQQEVAIKVLRPGIEVKEMVRRFQAEAQFTAALGKHPNIASLVDAGTTSDGMLYLVMDYVDGKRIDTYCDVKKLTNEQRIELFLDVCDAVQFAHQNAVIHRDLKPSNIMVSNSGEVRLIDFGIAKLMTPQLGFQRESTQTLFRVLTPAYASPEQARGDAPTTASDVYSLGVVLYLLLTGRSPYEVDTTDPQALANTIENVTPAPPSLAIHQTATPDDKTSIDEIAEKRGVTPAKLKRQLDGDLGSIVLMALRKEADRRYGTAAQLADDLRRYLSGHPIRARRDTIRYRTGKFIRRNRFAVSMGAILLVTLVAGMIGTSTQWYRAERATREALENAKTARQEAERASDSAKKEADARVEAEHANSLAQTAARQAELQAKTAEQISSFMLGLFQGADPVGLFGYQFGARSSDNEDPTVKELLERGRELLKTKLEDQPLVRAALMTKIGQIYLSLGSLDESKTLFNASLQLQLATDDAIPVDLIEAFSSSGMTSYIEGDYAASIDLFRKAIAISDATYGTDDPRGALARLMCGAITMESNLPGEWRAGKALVLEAVEICRSQENVSRRDLAHAIIGEAIVARTNGETAKASRLIAEATLVLFSLPEGGAYMQALTLAVKTTIDWQNPAKRDNAYEQSVQVVELSKNILGEKHPLVNYIQVDLSRRMFSFGQPENAEKFLRDGIESARVAYGRRPRTARALVTLGAQLRHRKVKLDEAVTMLREAVQIYSETLGGEAPYTAIAKRELKAAVAARQAAIPKGEKGDDG